MKIKKNILLLFVLFIISAIFYLPIINLPLAPYDEAVILVGAEKILNGQIPYRDYSSEYPPGQFYTLAALFKLFGVSVITERIYDLLIKSLLSLSIFLTINFLTSQRMAFIGWLMSLVWIQYSSFPAYPVYPSMFFIFISTYFLLHHMKEQKNYHVTLSAVSIVIAILFRHDLGGYAAIAISLVLIFRKLKEGLSWSLPIRFITVGFIAGLPVLAYFFMHSSLMSMFNDLVLIPAAFLNKQALPYPSLSRWTLPFYIFPLVLLTGAVLSLIQIRREKNDSLAYAILLISFIGIFCFNQARIRSDNIHLLPVALIGILLAPVLLYTWARKFSLKKNHYSVVCILFVIVFGITLSRPASVINMLMTRTNGYVIKTESPDFERASFSVLTPELKKTVSYIKSNTTANESIYVGVTNHDQFVFNDVIIYFLAERNSATRYHTLNPGVHTTSKIQKEVINEFNSNKPKLIVLVPRSRHEPNLSSIDSKVDLLDSYISMHFTLKKTFGMYEIWM